MIAVFKSGFSPSLKYVPLLSFASTCASVHFVKLSTESPLAYTFFADGTIIRENAIIIDSNTALIFCLLFFTFCIIFPLSLSII